MSDTKSDVTSAFSAIGKALGSIGAAFGVALSALGVGAGVIASAIAFEKRVSVFMAVNHEQLATRYAIEQLGVSEADISRVGPRTVRMWNRRVVDLDPGFVPWARQRVANHLSRIDQYQIVLP